MLAESDFAFNRRSCQKPTHPPTPTPSTSKRKGLQRPSTPVRQPTFLETGERTALGTRSKTSASGSLPKMGGLLQWRWVSQTPHFARRPPACHCLKHRRTGGAARAAGCFVGFARQDGSSCSASNKQKNQRTESRHAGGTDISPHQKKKNSSMVGLKAQVGLHFFLSECGAAPDTQHSKRSSKCFKPASSAFSSKPF